MGQLTPITLEDGTTIYIEAIDNTSTTPSVVVPNNPTIAGEEPKRGGVFIGAPHQQVPQTFQAIEQTIRAYRGKSSEAVTSRHATAEILSLIGFQKNSEEFSVIGQAATVRSYLAERCRRD